MQTGTYPVTSAIAQFYGAQTLKPDEVGQLRRGLRVQSDGQHLS